jgi:hypothetical protein
LLAGLERTVAWVDAGVATTLAAAAMWWMHRAAVPVRAPVSDAGVLAGINVWLFLIPALLAALASTAMFRRWRLRWLAQVPAVLLAPPLVGELLLSRLIRLLAGPDL